jgi:hypothetical protein
MWKSLKLYEPSMLDQETEEQVLPTIEDLAPEAQGELAEDIVLRKKSRLLDRGNMKFKR